MTFSEVIKQLPALTVGQRQSLVRHALDLDEPPLPPPDVAWVEDPLAALREHPDSDGPLNEMTAPLRSRFAQ